MTTLATRFNEAVDADPDGIAVICGGQMHTFREVAECSDAYAAGLAALGVTAGTRIASMVPPGFDFFALCYATFKLGAVPVVIDAGMELDNIGLCLDRAEPEVFIGIPLAHQGRLHFGWGQRSVRLNVTVGERGDWEGPELSELRGPAAPFAPRDLAPDDPAMILYTTGSTGPPKGALFTHANVNAQLVTLGRLFGMAPGGRDMPTLPTVAPYTVASGMTSVIPEMDFRCPGTVDPASLIEQINTHRVTSMFGSPALIDRVGRYGAAHAIELPTLKRVLTAAAPVSPEILERFARMLSRDAEMVVFYGATEALPVAVIPAEEILSDTASGWALGGGTCVGRPLGSMGTDVIRIVDEPLPLRSQAQPVAPGEIGELVVSGDEVSPAYISQPAANSHHKMRDESSGAIWHRMGDAVLTDTKGRLWFQGRVSQRVETPTGTLFTEPVEAVFNQHPSVRRTALVGVGAPGEAQPVLCVEMEEGEPRAGSPAVREELLVLGRELASTAQIEEILFHDGFPVDIRHNSKIFREKLAVWAVDALADASSPSKA